jgi:hypothetical protein
VGDPLTATVDLRAVAVVVAPTGADEVSPATLCRSPFDELIDRRRVATPVGAAATSARRRTGSSIIGAERPRGLGNTACDAAEATRAGDTGRVAGVLCATRPLLFDDAASSPDTAAWPSDIAALPAGDTSLLSRDAALLCVEAAITRRLTTARMATGNERLGLATPTDDWS